MGRGWKRPESVPFPSVWRRFDGKKEIDGVLPKFWVQDIPEDLYETATDLMVNIFMKDEPICKYSGADKDLEARQAFRELVQYVLKQRVALMCFMENPKGGKPIIAGLNMCVVAEKGEKPPISNSPIFQKLLGTLNYVSDMDDPYKKFGITEYLSAMGLLVLPEFRGQSLGLEILKAREPLCKAIGIKMTITHFTATASQKLAQKCGFKLLSEITYSDLQKKVPEYRYPGIEEHTKSLKLMYWIFD